LRVGVLGFRVQGLGFEEQGAEKDRDSGFRVWVLGFRF